MRDCVSGVCLPAHISPRREDKAVRRLPVRPLRLTQLSPFRQDLKDMMRKAGEVTFVDAHRPNKNEG